MTSCSPCHETPLRTARVARSYWRCGKCNTNHALDVPQCTTCTGLEAPAEQPAGEALGLGLRHWLVLLATWAAATALWATAAGLFANRS